jgi:anti-anti-sigma factor
MNKDIQITIKNKDDITVISITGDITIESKKLFFEAYQSDTVENSTKILLKFDKNCYIDSDGRATLIDILAEGCRKGQKVNVCGLSNHFQKIFDLVGLTNYILVFSSEKDALTDLSNNS